MPVVKIRRDEMDLVKEAAERLAHRTNSSYTIREERVQISRERSAEIRQSESKDRRTK